MCVRVWSCWSLHVPPLHAMCVVPGRVTHSTASTHIMGSNLAPPPPPPGPLRPQAHLHQLLQEQGEAAWRQPSLQPLRNCWQLAAVAAAFDGAAYRAAGPSEAEAYADFSGMCTWIARLVEGPAQVPQGLLGLDVSPARSLLVPVATACAR